MGFITVFKRNNGEISADSIPTQNVKDAPYEKKNAIQKLDELVGVEQLKNVIKITVGQRIVSNESIPGHYIFVGNPDTGKSEAAKIMGEIFEAVGILSKGHIVSVCPANLIGAYIGQSAMKTRKMCEKAIGGVLFVDETYQLSEVFNKSFGKTESLESLLILWKNTATILV